MIDRDVFFDAVRQKPFKGRLTQRQVDGLNAILDAWETAHAGKDLRWLAYALATTHHETGARMQPVHERGGKRYFFKMYDIGGRRPRQGARARQHQSGRRGEVSRARLRAAHRGATTTPRCREDSVPTSQAAIRPRTGCSILGLQPRSCSTGWKMACSQANRSRIISRISAPIGSERAIINPGDKAKLVAGYARDYYDALKAASLKL